MRSAFSLTLASALENGELLAGNALTLTGNGLASRLSGNSRDNTLSGGAGDDTLDGGPGADRLTGNSGAATLHHSADGVWPYGVYTRDLGSRGHPGSQDRAALWDKLRTFDIAGDGVLAGGRGNDRITSGDGDDLLAFNAGDGRDTVTAEGGDTPSHGGGIRFEDLALARDGTDLLLDTGHDEGLRFADWYAAKPKTGVKQLQVFAESLAAFQSGAGNPLPERAVQMFDFAALSTAFDAVQSSNPTLQRRHLANPPLAHRLAERDTAAFGGELAHA